jgi:hypothetical protein
MSPSETGRESSAKPNEHAAQQPQPKHDPYRRKASQRLGPHRLVFDFDIEVDALAPECLVTKGFEAKSPPTSSII